MASKKIATLEAEKSDLIESYIKLKSEHQKLFFKYQETSKENQILKNENDVLKKRIEETHNKDVLEKSVLKENKVLHAQLNQMKRTSTSLATPEKTQKKMRKKTPAKSPSNFNSSQDFEVEQLLKHRGRKGKREFLVRWRGFTAEHDSWQLEKELSCPKILKHYLKSNKLA